MSHSPNIGISVKQSERGKNSEQDKPVDCSPQTVVVLRDQNPDRRQIICQLIKSCGATTRELRDSEISRVESSPRQSVALVALGNRSSQDASSFGAIRALKLRGFKVISYEDNLFSWQIGTRCRALLSGSFLLLDSAARVFSAELQQALITAWKGETEQHLEEERVKGQMKDLGIVGVSSKNDFGLPLGSPRERPKRLSGTDSR